MTNRRYYLVILVVLLFSSLVTAPGYTSEPSLDAETETKPVNSQASIKDIRTSPVSDSSPQISQDELNTSTSSQSETVSDDPTSISSSLSTNNTSITTPRESVQINQSLAEINPEISDQNTPANNSRIFSDIIALTPENSQFSIEFDINNEEFLAVDGVGFSTEFRVNYTLFTPNGNIHDTVISTRSNQFHQFVATPTAGTWNMTLLLLDDGENNASLSITTNNNGVRLINYDNPQFQQFDYIDRGFGEYYRVGLSTGTTDYFFVNIQTEAAVSVNIYNSSYSSIRSWTGSNHYLSINVSDGAIISIYDSTGSGVDVRRTILLPNAIIDASPSRKLSIGENINFDATTTQPISMISFTADNIKWLSFSGSVSSSSFRVYAFSSNNSRLFTTTWQNEIEYRNLYDYDQSLYLIIIASSTQDLKLYTESDTTVQYSAELGDRLDLQFDSAGEIFYVRYSLAPSSIWYLFSVFTNSSTRADVKILNGSDFPTEVRNFSPDNSGFYYDRRPVEVQHSFIVYIEVPSNNYQVSIDLVNDSLTSDLTDHHHTIYTGAHEVLSYQYHVQSNQSTLMVESSTQHNFRVLYLNTTGAQFYSNTFNFDGERNITLFPTSFYNRQVTILLLTLPSANITMESRQQGSIDQVVSINQSYRVVHSRSQEYLVLTYSTAEVDHLFASYSANVSVNIDVRYYVNNSFIQTVNLASGIKSEARIISPGTQTIIIAGDKLDTFVYKLMNASSFPNKQYPASQTNYLFDSHGTTLALQIAGPGNSNTTFLGFGLNTTGKVRIMIWNGTIGSNLVDVFSLRASNPEVFKFYTAQEYTTDIYIHITSEQNQNMTLTSLNTGSTSFEASGIHTYQSATYGSMELWDLSQFTGLFSTLSIYAEVSTSAILYLVNSTAVLEKYTLSNDRFFVDYLNYDLDRSLKLVITAELAHAISWSLNTTVQTVHVDSSAGFELFDPGQSLTFSIPIEKFYDILELNATLLNSTRSYVSLVDPALSDVNTKILTQSGDLLSQSITNPSLGQYYITVLSSGPANYSITTTSVEQEPITSDIDIEFVSPTPSMVVFENNSSRIEPIYNGTVIVEVNITTPSTNIVQSQISFNDGTSWRDMVFNTSSTFFQYEWNTTRVSDGFTTILVRTQDSSNDFNSGSMIVYIDNIRTNDNYTFYYDNDPPAIELLNFRTGDYLFDTTVNLVFSISDQSGVSTVEYSTSLPEFNIATANDTGLYNIDWNFATNETTDYFYIRANDTLDQTDLVRLEVNILENRNTVGNITTYYDSEVPTLDRDTISISTTSNTTSTNVSLSYTMRDQFTGLQSVKATYQSLFNRAVAENKAVSLFSTQTNLAELTHNFTVSSGSDYANISIIATDLTGNKFRGFVEIIFDWVQPEIDFLDKPVSSNQVEIFYRDLNSSKIFVTGQDDIGVKQIAISNKKSGISTFQSPENFTVSDNQISGNQQYTTDLTGHEVRFDDLPFLENGTSITITVTDYFNNTISQSFVVIVSDQPGPSPFSKLITITLLIIGTAALSTLGYRYRKQLNHLYHRLRISIKEKILDKPRPDTCPSCGANASKMTDVCWLCGEYTY